MANPDEAPYTRILETQVAPVATAGNDLTTVIGVVREDEVVTAVTYIPASTITGANTNTRVVAVVDKAADASGSTSIASLQFNSGVNATGLVEKAITLSGTAANLNVSASDVLVFTSTHVGTGIADPGGVIRVALGRR